MPGAFFKKMPSMTHREVFKCSIQLPSKIQINHMTGMPAGADEDQSTRLSHMRDAILKFNKEQAPLPIIDTSQVVLTKQWQSVFVAIDRGELKSALMQFDQLPADDLLAQCLRAVHSVEYLQRIITYSIKARRNGIIKINQDVLITPKSFEILIYDIALTLQNTAKITFSFGLPTHHAYRETGAGFCVLNKSAILLKYAELTHNKSPKFVIVGTDVNRDDGLCHILMNTLSHLDICHVDIFDSRVYPHQNFAYISEQSGIRGINQYWSANRLSYYAVDLGLTVRRGVTIHPAILFALEKIAESIELAKRAGQQVVILLPTGWDSHKDETAYCGKCIEGKNMPPIEAEITRFNNTDLDFFYTQIFTLYKKYEDIIAQMYWGLEGGYDRSMYEKQIPLLMHNISRHLLSTDLELAPQAMPASGLI